MTSEKSEKTKKPFAHLIFGLEQKLLTGICPGKKMYRGEHHEVGLQNTFLEDLHFETGSGKSAVTDAHSVILEVDRQEPSAIAESIS